MPTEYTVQCPMWVKLRNTQYEQMSSALTPRTDIGLVARKKTLRGSNVMESFSATSALSHNLPAKRRGDVVNIIVSRSKKHASDPAPRA